MGQVVVEGEEKKACLSFHLLCFLTLSSAKTTACLSFPFAVAQGACPRGDSVLAWGSIGGEPGAARAR